MSKLNFISTVLLTCSFISVAGQKQTWPAGAKDQSTIPFYVTAYNNIVIKAVLNNQDTVDLMLHTASSDVTITEAAFVKLKTIKFGGTADSVKSWGGANNASDFSKNNSLKIGNRSWREITVWKDQNSGQETDGKFGLNLFENKVVSVDFNKSRLAITTQLPGEVKDYERFQLVVRGDELFIKALCQTKNGFYTNDFLLHSGYGGDILLDDKFVSDTKIDQQITITGEKKLQDAYGNVLTTKKGSLPLFKIGKQQLADVPVGFFTGAIGQQKMSIIGGDILKRFNWIIDAKREFIYFKPNHLFKSRFSKA